nr:c-type cytochrome [uncultured Roseateles sp.]
MKLTTFSRTLSLAFAGLSIGLVASPAFANAELAQKKNCMACHAIDKKLVGPAYKDVAAKYAKDKTAVATLSAKIVKGGAGVWGPVPMPANTQVNEAEAKQLATWVLSLK